MGFGQRWDRESMGDGGRLQDFAHPETPACPVAQRSYSGCRCRHSGLHFDGQVEAELLSPQSYQNVKAENTLETKLTFVEMFNKLDSNGNGYISKEEFATMSDLGYFKRPLTKLELNDLFDKADLFQSGRLNLFEFMSIMRKTVRVEIQEIGYGYLPLAWGSLAAYWIGLGMQE